MDRSPAPPSDKDETAANLSRTAAARHLIENYANDLRKLLEKLRKLLN